MNFKDFTEKIEVLKGAKLGGVEAQFKMAPKLRLPYNKEKIAAKNPRKAAVLALFYPNKINETSDQRKFKLTRNQTLKQKSCNAHTKCCLNDQITARQEV